MSERAPGPTTEERLDELREQAARGELAPAAVPATEGTSPVAGYYGRPALKPPVWTWEIPLYLFVGGMAGMAAVLALAAFFGGERLGYAGSQAIFNLPLGALRLAVVGTIVSTVLLVLDLGRPLRFLAMLRVFKIRSPMSVGAWTLVLFSAFVTGAWAILEFQDLLLAQGLGEPALRIALAVLAGAAAATGAVLATYTGVLLGATAIPVWRRHHRLLPIHFGIAGLGSAAAALELFGYAPAPLAALGWTAAGLETLLFLAFEARAQGVEDSPLREGPSGWMLRISSVLTGPAALLLRAVGLVPLAAISFLVGALLSRYGWVAAGRASALDPAAALGRRG